MEKEDENQRLTLEELSCHHMSKEDQEVVLKLAKKVVEVFSQEEGIMGGPLSRNWDSPEVYLMKDFLFRTSQWKDFIPKMKLDPGWEIQPLPSRGYYILEFKVYKGKDHVIVKLHGYNGFIDGVPTWETISSKGKIAILDFNEKDCSDLISIIRSSLEDK